MSRENANWGASLNVMDGNGDIMDSAKYTVKIYDQNFNEMTDWIFIKNPMMIFL